MEKSKTPQNAGGKQHPGTEQVRSGTHIQKEQGEKIQAPKSGEQQRPKHEQGKTGKKVGGTGS